jgi:hypothetical protein
MCRYAPCSGDSTARHCTCQSLRAAELPQRGMAPPTQRSSQPLSDCRSRNLLCHHGDASPDLVPPYATLSMTRVCWPPLVQRLTLRSGFATHFSYDGVAPRTARAATQPSSSLRHSFSSVLAPGPHHACSPWRERLHRPVIRPSTGSGLRRAGPSLLDVAGALATLPDLSLQGVAQADAGTGESDARSRPRWDVLELCTLCGPLPPH